MGLQGPLTRGDILERIAAHPIEGSPQDMRAAFRGLVASEGPSGPLTMSSPDTALPPVVWFHGGGYVFGGPDTHARIARHLSKAHGLTVHLPEIPLAPEHPWPAQLTAALAAVETERTPILAGDSAGGHLALVTALEMARAGRPPAALLLFSPNTDRSGHSRTRQAMNDDDPMVADAGDRELARQCFGARPADDPQVSPMLGDLSLLPPTWIEVGTPEVLLDDSRLLHARGVAMGAEVHLTETPGLLHMGQIWAPHWEPGTASLDRAARFVRARFSDQTRTDGLA